MQQELIILVGYPGAGKTTFTANYKNDKYIILHGDELKTSSKMIKSAILHINNGKSIVFDATNPTKEKRSEYIKLANDYNLPIRCIHISTSFEESLLRNLQRPEDKIVPRIVYYIYKKKFEEPTTSEGFIEVNKIIN
jgi:bifunctional polynucleotide phosphatase/kinase